MVRWLSPGQLTATGVRALLSGIFGSYADRREVQAALHQLDQARVSDPDSAPFDGLVHRYGDRGDAQDGLWIDFVADLGDGFDSTYTIAWLLAQASLPKPRVGAGPVRVIRENRDAPAPGDLAPESRTRRGHILIMGGDQVYPTASRDEYSSRLAGPYAAALPWCLNGHPPHLYGIPGNHDWYDGLTAFLRLFCQRRWIGGWKTQQERSYFALQLPSRWWLLGVDVQLESDIDQPQRAYFHQVAQQMQRGDRVILCTAEPTWVHTATDPTAFDNLAYIEKSVLAPRGVDLALTLTGDLHHYSRYTDASRPHESKHHKITAGGGGAYLLGTQLLPREVHLPAPAAPREREGTTAREAKERYAREAEYPSVAKSVALKWGAVGLGWKNPSFLIFLGIMYALFAWFLQSASKVSMGMEARNGTGAGTAADLMTFARETRPGRWREVLDACWTAAAHAPLVVAFSLLIIGGLIAFCAPDVERSRVLRASKRLQRVVRIVIGSIHGLAHLSLAVGLIWFFSWFNLDVLPGWLGWDARAWNVDRPAQAALFVVEMAVVGGAVGGMLMSLFLLPGINYNEAFSSQHLEGFKNFVRLHIAGDGTLTLYPYGVDRPARWQFCPKAEPEAPYYVPTKAPEVRLIDGPVTLATPGFTASERGGSYAE